MKNSTEIRIQTAFNIIQGAARFSKFYNEQGTYTIVFGESSEMETLITFNISETKSDQMVARLNKAVRALRSKMEGQEGGAKG